MPAGTSRARSERGPTRPITQAISRQSAASCGGGDRRDLRSTTGGDVGRDYPDQWGGATPKQDPLGARGLIISRARRPVGGRAPRTATSATCIQPPPPPARYARSQTPGEPVIGQTRAATQGRAARFPPSNSPRVCQIKTRKFILRVTARWFGVVLPNPESVESRREARRLNGTLPQAAADPRDLLTSYPSGPGRMSQRHEALTGATRHINRVHAECKETGARESRG